MAADYRTSPSTAGSNAAILTVRGHSSAAASAAAAHTICALSSAAGNTIATSTATAHSICSWSSAAGKTIATSTATAMTDSSAARSTRSIPPYLIGRMQMDGEEIAVVSSPLVEPDTIAEVPVISMDDDDHPTSPTSTKIAVEGRPQPKLRICSVDVDLSGSPNGHVPEAPQRTAWEATGERSHGFKEGNPERRTVGVGDADAEYRSPDLQARSPSIASELAAVRLVLLVTGASGLDAARARPDDRRRFPIPSAASWLGVPVARARMTALRWVRSSTALRGNSSDAAAAAAAAAAPSPSSASSTPTSSTFLEEMALPLAAPIMAASVVTAASKARVSSWCLPGMAAAPHCCGRGGDGGVRGGGCGGGGGGGGDVDLIGGRRDL
ncbi:Os08g0483301 [Oryza sativa Japonica Group]|nr:Os08g0483301 [Oryza sativa Japonica Group]